MMPQHAPCLAHDCAPLTLVHQQVHISYGELSNDALVLMYGFVVDQNPHDRCAAG